MTKKETIAGLKYIAKSPRKEHGGFHPETINVAKSALRYLAAKKKRKP